LASRWMRALMLSIAFEVQITRADVLVELQEQAA
jgi:hypothetical protein